MIKQNIPGVVKVHLNYKSLNADVVMVELSNGEQWILKGYCNRCGVCCDNVNAQDHPFMAKENGEPGCKWNKYETLNGERVSTCLAMTCKPGPCQIYPRDPYEELFPECSYEWERIK
jgi:hypothetical protein